MGWPLPWLRWVCEERGFSGGVDELHSAVAAVCLGLGGRMGSCYERRRQVRRDVGGKLQDVGDEGMDPATNGVASCRRRERRRWGSRMRRDGDDLVCRPGKRSR